MAHRPYFFRSTMVLFCILLGACAPKVAAPGVSGMATPVSAVMTPTMLPPTPSATAFPGPITYEEALPLFKYDASAPFDVTVNSENVQSGATVMELTYQAADAQFTSKTVGRIVAYLVKPAGDGPFAGVLFMHGLGSGWGNRKEFLDEAVALAGRGVVSLLPMGIFPWMVPFTGDAQTDQMNCDQAGDRAAPLGRFPAVPAGGRSPAHRLRGPRLRRHARRRAGGRRDAHQGLRPDGRRQQLQQLGLPIFRQTRRRAGLSHSDGGRRSGGLSAPRRACGDLLSIRRLGWFRAPGGRRPALECRRPAEKSQSVRRRRPHPEPPGQPGSPGLAEG